MPESPTLRVTIIRSLPARSLTSPYPSSCPSRTPSSSQSLFCSTAQPHLSLPPRCLTPYPHHIVFRSPSPNPRPFPPSSISPFALVIELGTLIHIIIVPTLTFFSIHIFIAKPTKSSL
uniref:Unplaced genomic scaffold supercont1.11, whole genome shotgun sequence n=1 Tax=Cryptococcus bacillisporus CA1280 TaxID=1296109 RepID=A0A0D0UEM4_CRYGA|nr:hypothetical protein I312_04219 [Cryptococcus bacillisporus CA1280]